MRATFNEIFPEHAGVVLQDGHVDRVTGPRCMVKMSEGPFVGRYIIAHTEAVLAADMRVKVSERTGRIKATEVA